MRKQSGRFIVEGDREIVRAIENGIEPLELWLAPESSMGSYEKYFKTCYETSTAVFEKIAYRASTEWAVATFAIPQHDERIIDDVLSNAKRIVVMEGIEKPGNLGAVLRTSLAAGIDAVLLADAAIDLFGPNVVRNATGALFEQRVFSGTSEEVQQWLSTHKFDTYITHMHSDATSLYDWNPKEKVAMVVGEEARGLSDFWLEAGYTNLIIPMKGNTVDSLNVSVAVAVMAYHLDYLKQK
ncbi:MAG: hypothetical protein RL754_186 [Bacteroidota bacterium]